MGSMSSSLSAYDVSRSSSSYEYMASDSSSVYIGSVLSHVKSLNIDGVAFWSSVLFTENPTQIPCLRLRMLV